jgi:hypothetical protein
MKKIRLLLLTGLAFALPLVVPPPTLSCKQSACESYCGGPGMGTCLNNECQCY